MDIFTRYPLSNMPPSIHGALDYGELARLGLSPESVVDFSANSNPYGPHESVLQAVSNAVTASNLAHYPDRDWLALLEVLSIAEGVPQEYLLPTNGASELIQLIALAFVTPGSRHLIFAPTFGEYVRAIHLMDGSIHECWPNNKPNLHLDVETMVTAIRKLKPSAVWLCNPNNPTGQHWPVEQFDDLRTADPDNQVLWVIDESYRYFVQREGLGKPSSSPLNGRWSKNTIIIRSLTKEFSLAGLRLGYAVAAPHLIEVLHSVQIPWSVNTLAQVAGVAALQPEVTAWRDESLGQLHQHAAELWANLSALGFTVLPTSTTYALVEVGDAIQFRQALLPYGLVVRNCTSFGLPNYVRIAAQLPENNQRLINAIKKFNYP